MAIDNAPGIEVFLLMMSKSYFLEPLTSILQTEMIDKIFFHTPSSIISPKLVEILLLKSLGPSRGGGGGMISRGGDVTTLGFLIIYGPKEPHCPKVSKTLRTKQIGQKSKKIFQKCHHMRYSYPPPPWRKTLTTARVYFPRWGKIQST